MLALEDAQQRVLSAAQPLGAEMVSINEAIGRVANENIPAPIDLPPFENSAMDGYAVRAQDLTALRPENPVGLRLIGRVAAGEVFDGQVDAGQCVRLFTGSPLPPGANAVVMQEDTRIEEGQGEMIWFLDKAKPGENVRLRGEDVRRGTMLVNRGTRLTVGRVSLLAASGVTKVPVGRQPTVGLLATGSELQEPGQPLEPGRIYESNRVGLAALVARAGAVPRIFPLVKDTLPDTQKALENALATCDVVVVSGGVSVGDFDFVKPAFAKIGGELEFWKVAIKPGKPFVCGRWSGKFLFGLPGNPVSALVTFLVLVRPAIARMQGAGEVSLPTQPGVLAAPLANPGERRHFMRVVVDGDGKTHSAGAQASHSLSSLAEANGLVDVPPGTTFHAGSVVQVIRWD